MPDTEVPTQEIEGVSTLEEAQEPSSLLQNGDKPSLTDIREDEDVMKMVRRVTGGKFTQHKTDRDGIEKVWENADYMVSCGVDATKRAADQVDKTEADTGSTLFYRQVRTLASLDLDVIFGRPGEAPVRYDPISVENVPFSAEDAEQISHQRQALLRYTMKVDDFPTKFIEGVFLLTKYSNQPVMMFWKKRVEKRWMKKPRMKDGEITGFDWEKREVIVKDHPELRFPANENFYIDQHIGDLQDQQVIVIEELADMTEIAGRAVAGDYAGVEDIEAKHKYEGDGIGEDEADTHTQHLEHRGIDAQDDSMTGMFKLLHVWAKLPIDDDGEWDEAGNPPSWWMFTFVHDIEEGPCIRAIDNPDPDDEFPGFMWHRNPDDADLAYHIADSTVLKPNFDEATTRKNQYFDNLSQINRRPVMSVRGNLMADTLVYTSGEVNQVKRIEDTREMSVLDTSQTMLACLQYVDDDSNRTVGTDKALVGEALGSRTSATEATNVNSAATRPHSILIRYHLEQFLKWYAVKVQRYWEMWGDPNRVLAVTDQNEIIRVDLGRIFGDFDAEITIIQEFEQDIVDQQNMAFVMQAIIPNFMDILGPTGKRALLAKILRRFKTDPNEIIPEFDDTDAEFVASVRITEMLESGALEEPQPGENHKAHLRVAQGMLLRLGQSEDPEIAGRVELIELYIEMLQSLISAGPAGSVAAAPGNETAGEVLGNSIAAGNPASNVGNLPVAG